MNRPMLEAHQGVATDAPGNTLAAFRKAAALGYDMVELDTKFTKDDRCVILHDRTLDRTARLEDGSPLPEATPIASLTLEEARRYDLGLAFGEAFRGEKIPTLEEVLAFSEETGVLLKFDNVLQSHTPGQRRAMFAAIASSGAAGNVGVTSNSVAFIRDEILPYLPHAHIHYDGEVDADVLAALAALLPPEQLTVWLRYDNRRTSWAKPAPVGDESAAAVHRVGTLGLWLLETEEEYAAARDRWSADVVETDGSLRPGE